MSRIPGLAVSAVVFFMATSSLCAQEAPSWKKLNEYADAITPQKALAALSERPESIDRLYVTGMTYLNEYDPQNAEQYFARIVQKDPQNVLGLWGIAECRRRVYAFDEAQGLLKQVIARDPGFAPAFISLGYMQYLKTDFQDAADTVAEVIRMGRGKVDINNYVRAHSLYGGAKGMIAHYAGPVSKVVNGSAVIRHLRIAKKLLPDAPATLFGYGSYFLLIPPVLGRNVDKAIELLERAIEKDPKFVDAYVRLAQAYKLNGDLARYEQLLNKALELDPQNIVALDVKNGTCRFICVEITD